MFFIFLGALCLALLAGPFRTKLPVWAQAAAAFLGILFFVAGLAALVFPP